MPDSAMEKEACYDQIDQTPVFCRRSLRERMSAYEGQLNLSEELPREQPVGSEVW